MKSPPLASLARSNVVSLELPGAVVAPVNDVPQRSHVEWKLERSRPGREVAVPGDVTDAASADQAYQLWKHRVWGFASRLGVPSEQLEDATQDVFTAVFRRWDDFLGQSTRRTWVLGFVPRVASSYRRRRRQPAEPAGERSADQTLASLPSGEHDPFESTLRREAKRIVSTFLDSLPEIDRQLFVLVDLEDASVVEAAEILELGARRAYKILDRARRALEATLVRHRAAESRRLP